MTRKSIPELLDQSVEWTGIPKLTQNGWRRRPMRWWPIFAIAIASTGLLLAILRRDVFFLGYAILMVGFVASVIFTVAGPVKPFGDSEETDEFDIALRQRSLALSLSILSTATLILLFTIPAIAIAQNWPMRELARSMMACAFYLVTVRSSLPTLTASWLMPRSIDDEDDQ